ncbi:ankyrin [Macroventuria anomochaeta]|uniref:Ankyrin n=1 Tax=Macroventuria anomochaeta TaxID=301207 RepID=A0ACB6SDW3_9PLEO|nr:ankyrin [Macroventuria anomochaeta]KAF2632351.1 ankyrin [Macroventuria anomochaeta]
MGCLDVVELLLEKGAKSIANKDGSTPLNIAASYGQLKVVELLLNKGADLSLANNNGRTPLSSASFHGHVEVAKLLLEKGAYNASSGLEPHYGTIANMLALKGYTDLLRFIVEHSNASMNEADNHNRNPLQFAASGGHIDSFQYLVSKGLQFTTLDAKGDNLISLAASGGSLDILTVVLEQKLDAVARPEHWNPLHWACRAGKVKVVELLIAQGWKSDIVTVAGLQGEWTPLAVAIFHGNNDMLDGLSESSRAALGAQNEKPYLTGKRHGGCSCNGCYHEIYGPRFQCMVCKFQDYCFMCKPFLQHLHKGHKWKLFESWDPSKTYGEQRL